MKHLRRSSRQIGRVGIGGRVIKGEFEDVEGHNDLIKAPKQWAPKPVNPPIRNPNKTKP